MIPAALRPPLVRLRRRIHEALGSDRYSRPALHELDRKLERHLGFPGGWFLEAGANDGYTQSNTYYFEKARGWRGLLVEPIPELAQRCRRERPRAQVIEAALVSLDYAAPTVELEFAGLMSVSQNAFDSDQARRAHLARGRVATGTDRSYRIAAPARTLDSILAREGGGRAPDLLTLDVEGDELNALAGLRAPGTLPALVCVEARDPGAVTRALAFAYDQAEVLFDSGSYQDLLFRLRRPAPQANP